MRRGAGWILAAAVAAAGVGGRAAPPEQGTAVVDMERLVRAHPDYRSAEALLKQQVDEFELEQKELQAESQKLRQAWEEAREEAGNKALTDKARGEKEAVAREKLAALREHEAKRREALQIRQKNLGDQSKRMQRRIIEKVRAIVSEHAKKRGLALVLDSSGVTASGIEAVVFRADKADITEELLAVVEKEPAEKAKGPDKDAEKK